MGQGSVPHDHECDVSNGGNAATHTANAMLILMMTMMI